MKDDKMISWRSFRGVGGRIRCDGVVFFCWLLRSCCRLIIFTCSLSWLSSAKVSRLSYLLNIPPSPNHPPRLLQQHSSWSRPLHQHLLSISSLPKIIVWRHFEYIYSTFISVFTCTWWPWFCWSWDRCVICLPRWML